ncbi:MAG TPA: cytochrome c-type biogenesis protein CcmH [Cellvibrionales bacterium]|jgi:cytochrome c-type biogenesis protein CcmH|nr:cytochrome c-type biogenesis protein CcmH [Pseudomonadales bacterium]HAB54923.1 cytochrome c-type biogenesis protein CcmH [Cellvibrionales bacterium]
MILRAFLVTAIFLLSLSGFTSAADSSGLANQDSANELKVFSDPDMRQRYYGLIAELRCPKCQNQNLADSDAPIATDLRNELYLLINDNYSDADILEFMASRYGEFVLYSPPVNSVTAVLWIIPAGLGLLGFAIVAFILWRNQEDDEASNV